MPTNHSRISLWSLAAIFLRIGCFAFGGFMPLVSMAQREMVERRKLLQEEELLDAISLANLLPGPIAVNIVGWFGYRVRRSIGAIVAITSVIFPSFLIMLLLSHAYLQFGHLEWIQRLIRGFLPALAATVALVAVRMIQKNITIWSDYVPGVIAVFALLISSRSGNFGVTFALVLLAGLFGWARHRFTATCNETVSPGSTIPRGKLVRELRKLCLLVVLTLFVFFTALFLEGEGVLRLGALFAGLGIMLFGGAFVAVPLLQDLVVTQNAWLTTQEFLDVIAIAQVLPGPNLVSVSYVGYKIAGLSGAIACTIGIFGPPAALMIFSSRFLDECKASAAFQASLRLIRLTVIGMIAFAVWIIFRASLVDEGPIIGSLLVSSLLFALAYFAQNRWKWELTAVIPFCGLCGFWMYPVFSVV
ncbi:MAG: chromate efflux transporter [Verrucomicrobiota bacterium]